MTRSKVPMPNLPVDDDTLNEMLTVLQQGVSEGNSLVPELERMIAGYRKLLRSFSKTVSISDRYQSQLMDLKARLEVTASTDLLTGLANRWKIMEQLQSEHSRAERHGGSFSVLIADLDHFKIVNDTYGHLAGDRVLKAIADCLRRELRAEDFCGRWGGEEFLIILPETGLQQAALVAEKLLAAIRQTKVLWEDKGLSVTMSFGLGCFSRGMSLDGCIKLADDALFVAKKQGRDRYFAAQG